MDFEKYATAVNHVQISTNKKWREAEQVQK